MEASTAERTIRATLAQLGLAETAIGSVSGTISRRPEHATLNAPLPVIAMDGGDADLVTRGELGRGGMGVVHVAEQRSLLRDVAVKTGLTRDASVVAALVREARVMGSLEHPNLVPVHALGVDRDGAPVLVMKRVEGVSWRALLADPDHAGWKSLLAGHDDRLRANIEVLSQVCRALAFAHDKGVVHRDVKPENVMIGRFGEVYLLDWGIALRLSEAADEPRGIVGTPAYLSPEMAHGEPLLVDERTDVYLLGGTLYQVLTGQMPHAAPTPVAALVQALLGEMPSLGADVPAELAALVRHAMAAAIADRLASADSFLEGLKRFLASRETDAMVADARSVVARAAAAITREGPGSSDAYRALIEARFGFMAARRVRPRDEGLRAELDGCLAQLVERELALRSPGGARALLAELATPRADLESRLAALERDVEAERAAVDTLRDARRNSDTSVALKAMQRAVTAAAIVSVPALSFLTWDRQAHARVTPPSWAIAGNLAGLVAVLLAFYVGRRTVLANHATRRIGGFLAMVPTTLCVCNSVSLAVGRTIDEASVTTGAAVVCLVTCGTLTVLPDLWPAVVTALVGSAILILAPQTANIISALGIPLFLAILARALRLQAGRSRVSDEDLVAPR